MSTPARQRPPSSTPSTLTTNLSHAHSVRTTTGLRPPAVVTSPPWAKDEPPSPKEHSSTLADNYLDVDSRPSDVVSHHSSYGPANDSRWWTFTLPRPSREPPPEPMPSSSSIKAEKKGVSFRDRRSMSWLPMPATIRDGTSFQRREKDPETGATSPRSNWDLTIPLPSAPAPFTLAHNRTPGWESPWTARTPNRGSSSPNHSYGLVEEEADQAEDLDKSPTWRNRKKRLRAFVLTNTYVPLLFRFINLTFTTAALGVAIKIRLWEMRANVMGIVGSSPTLVIIFAPLTLVHVMVAVYLEYFGRPLGLWRTSAKLFHTLSEVVFICAWSAALSLCFDNFFTSLIPCAAASRSSWYNQLPRSQSPFANGQEGGVGDKICDYQLALICLVGIGLLMYCTNLVISLFRIFEKVKYHPGGTIRSS